MSLLCSSRLLGGAFVLAVAILCSCGPDGSRGSSAFGVANPEGRLRQTPVAHPVAPPTGLKLPAPSSIPLGPRTSSNQDALILNGSSTSGLLPANGVVADLSVLSFDSDYTSGGPISGLAFAGYEFSPFVNPGDAIFKLKLYWQSAPLNDDYFVALANFDTNRWEFYGADAFNATPSNPDTARFTTPAGQSYVDDVNLRALVVVILAGTDFARLEKIQVNNLDPIFESASIPDQALTGEVVNFSASASDPDSLTIGYLWDFGDGTLPETVVTNDISHTFAQAGVYQVSVSIADSDGGLPLLGASEQISVVTAGNDPPTVSLTANDDDAGVTGKRPLGVDFNAVANDSDGSIAKIEWDLDGDTVFELDSGLVAQQSQLYTEIVSIDVSVRVTDNDGGQATDSVAINSGGGIWSEVLAVENTGRGVGTPRLALIGGRAAIAFQDMTADFLDSDIAFVRSTNDDGDAAWGTVTSIETDAGGSLFTPVLAEINGKPAVIYHRALLQTVQYEQALDSTGGSWTGTPVDLVVASTFQYSLDTVNGFPAASYGVTGTFPESELRYRRATDADGLQAWGTERVIDTDSAVSLGSFSSLEIVNGLPAVCYGDGSNGRVLYKRSLDSNGDAWGNVEIICDAGGQTGAAGHLFMVNSHPAAAFAKQGAKLSFSRADSTSGDAWPATQPDLDQGFVNSNIYGAGIYANLPCIAYSDFSAKEIRFLLANDSDGSSWSAPETVTSVAPAPNTEGSFLIVNGKPAIAWSGTGDDTIHYLVYK